MEMRRRLDTVVARIGGLRSSVLILEDLNHLDDAGVALSLARVVESLRRRDRALLVTCYRRPSVRSLADVGLNQGCVVECTYFSEAEAKDLVHLNGGDPTRWAPIAYAAAAGGHPQLTHAFVVGIAARGWPIQETRAIVSRGLSSDDIDAARDAARRNLVAALPEGTRNALYRLSLAGVRFSRSFAVAVTALPPPIAQAGECLDQLAGPWIEAIGRDSYRVSPLAS